jgi:hypothetical protein
MAVAKRACACAALPAPQLERGSVCASVHWVVWLQYLEISMDSMPVLACACACVSVRVCVCGFCRASVPASATSVELTWQEQLRIQIRR